MNITSQPQPATQEKVPQGRGNFQPPKKKCHRVVVLFFWAKAQPRPANQASQPGPASHRRKSTRGSWYFSFLQKLGEPGQPAGQHINDLWVCLRTPACLVTLQHNSRLFQTRPGGLRAARLNNKWWMRSLACANKKSQLLTSIWRQNRVFDVLLTSKSGFWSPFEVKIELSTSFEHQNLVFLSF